MVQSKFCRKISRSTIAYLISLIFSRLETRLEKGSSEVDEETCHFIYRVALETRLAPFLHGSSGLCQLHRRLMGR